MRRRTLFALVAGLVIAGGSAALFIATASADGPIPPPQPPVAIAVNLHRPTSGHLFSGLVVYPRDQGARITKVFCNARVGRTHLAAVKRTFNSSVKMPDAAQPQKLAVICSWHIPANSGGKQLQLWNSVVLVADKRRAWVNFTWPDGTPGGQTDTPEWTWIIKP